MAVLDRQIKEGLDGVTGEQLAGMVLAYEPVWAIGTGRNATPAQAGEAHFHIRQRLKQWFGLDAAERCRVMYGGSVKPDNIAQADRRARCRRRAGRRRQPRSEIVLRDYPGLSQAVREHVQFHASALQNRRSARDSVITAPLWRAHTPRNTRFSRGVNFATSTFGHPCPREDSDVRITQNCVASEILCRRLPGGLVRHAGDPVHRLWRWLTHVAQRRSATSRARRPRRPVRRARVVSRSPGPHSPTRAARCWSSRSPACSCWRGPAPAPSRRSKGFARTRGAGSRTPTATPTCARATARATRAAARWCRAPRWRRCAATPRASPTAWSRSRSSHVATGSRTSIISSGAPASAPAPAEVETFRDMSPAAAVAHLVDYAGRPDDADERIGRPDHAQVATNNLFAPDIDIDDARQRWLFRMVHTRRPLQEKMALFWHNHFATAYSKLAADSDRKVATKMLAHKPGSLRGPMGQIELFRQYALGSYRDLLYQVAQDPATVVWLDGQFNTRAKPQENFGREIMELFSVGVGYYTEPDVYAAARVFSGWNLRNPKASTKTTTTPTRSSCSTPISTRPPRRRSRFRSTATAAARFQRRRRHAGRPRSDQRAGDAPGDGAAPGAEVLELLHQRDPSARSGVHRRPPPTSTCRAARASGRSSTRSSTRRGSTIPPCTTRAIHGRSSSWCAPSRNSAGRTSRSTRRGRRWPTWGRRSTSRRTSAAGRWAPAGSRPPRCWRAQFRRHAGVEPEEFLGVVLQPQASSPQALMTAMRERVTTAPFDSQPEQALLNYLVAGGAWTGSESQVTPGPPGSRGCWSRLPNTSWCRQGRP